MLETGSRAYRRAIVVLAFSAFLVFSNLYSVQPLLSLFSQQFNASATTVNWIFAGASLGMSVCLIPWALLGDALGRQRIMYLSLALVSMMSLLLALSETLSSWIVFRVLQGVALAGLPAVAVAYITEEFESRAVIGVVGIYIAFNSIGGISGRLLSAWITEHLGTAYAMLFFTGLTLLGTLLLFFYLPKEQYFVAQSLKIKPMIGNLCGHIRNPLLWRAFLISGLCVGIFINLFSVVTLRLSQAPWFFSTFQMSLLFLCYLGGTFAAGTVGKLTKRLRPVQGMLLGWAILVIGVALSFFQSLSLMILGLLMCSIGFFALHALASAWVGRHAPYARALASALYLSTYYLGASLGGFYLLSIYQQQAWHCVIIGAEAVLLLVPVLIYGLFKAAQYENA